MVVKTKKSIFIIEFKVKDTAENAIAQIKKMEYYTKYKSESKTIYLIGIACNEKEIKDYLVEKIDN